MSIAKPLIIVAHPSLEVRGMLARRIEGAGCSVQTCGDGEEALELARKGRPQAVLVGVGLDGGRGAAAADKIRRISPEIRILLTPIRDEELRRAVESIVRESAARETGTISPTRDVNRTPAKGSGSGPKKKGATTRAKR